MLHTLLAKHYINCLAFRGMERAGAGQPSSKYIVYKTIKYKSITETILRLKKCCIRVTEWRFYSINSPILAGKQ